MQETARLTGSRELKQDRSPAPPIAHFNTAGSPALAVSGGTLSNGGLRLLVGRLAGPAIAGAVIGPGQNAGEAQKDDANRNRQQKSIQWHFCLLLHWSHKDGLPADSSV
jgi:hypothetical protein